MTTTTLWPAYAVTAEDKTLVDLAKKVDPSVRSFVEAEHLDDDLLTSIKTIYLPLAIWITNKHQGHPIIIGINGAQGSGKSTLSKLLGILLEQCFGKSTVQVSIDDLYLSHQQRLALAHRVHPLLKVRGVPGTHDVELGRHILAALKGESGESAITIPVFDKARDDLLPKPEWTDVEAPVDIVLFEGWCVGAAAQSSEALSAPSNELENLDDPDCAWRTYVNQQLLGPYQQLFDAIDYLIMLKVPDMTSVFEWRNLQEEKLRQKASLQATATKIMTSDEVARFIMFYERITRHCLEEMPQRADVVLELNKAHQVCNVRLNE